MSVLTTKEKANVREEIKSNVSLLNLANGFEFKGFTKEGAAFSDGTNTFIIKAVVKNEGYDLDSAIEEYDLAEQLRLEKAKTKEK